MFKYLLLLICFTFSSLAQKPKIDALYYNAQVYTVNNSFEIKEAFAVHNGKFHEVSDLKTLESKYSFSKKVDLKQKAVYPGFIDPHSHFIGFSQMLGQCDLVGTKSFTEIIEKLKEFKKNNEDADWIIGRGWDQNDWDVKTFPNKDALDELFPNQPVMLTRIDGHALLANSKAMQMAKISPSSKINGGEVEVMDGQLTGIFIDNAMGFIKRVIPAEDKDKKTKLLIKAQDACFAVGLTTVSEAGVNREDIDLLLKLQKTGVLKIRDYAMISIGLGNIAHFKKTGTIKTPRLNVRSFKLYADGALGSRGAALIEPYTDASSQNGLMVLSEKELDLYFKELSTMPFQANTHCIGDRANRIVLDLYGKYLKTKNDKRWRIEHAQVVHTQDVPKFGKYSIIPSVQSTHATSDMYWAEERLGKSRVKTAYAFKDLMKENKLIANGSDFPVEDINPLFGFHSAYARQDAKNYPSTGYQTENALSRIEALKAMTIWAAYANFEEKEKGSIEKGKYADFVVLENDIMKIESPKVRNTKVQATFVNGEKVFGN